MEFNKAVKTLSEVFFKGIVPIVLFLIINLTDTVVLFFLLIGVIATLRWLPTKTLVVMVLIIFSFIGYVHINSTIDKETNTMDKTIHEFGRDTYDIGDVKNQVIKV